MTYYRPDDTYTQGPLVVTTLFGILALLTCVLRAYVLRVRREKCAAQDWLVFAATVWPPRTIAHVKIAGRIMVLINDEVLHICFLGNPVGM